MIFQRLIDDAGSDWDTASLLDIADYKNGLAMQKFRPDTGDEGLPVLKIRELGQGFCGSDAERCKSGIVDSAKVHDGDLIFSWSGTLLLDFWAGGNAGLNQHLFKVTSSAYPSWFYYGWTKHHLARFIMLAKDRATTMGHIKRSALAESEVVIPPENILLSQTQLMQPIIDQYVMSKIEARKLAVFRDSLLPKLMSGEIDVSEVNLTQLNSHLAETLRPFGCHIPAIQKTGQLALLRTAPYPRPSRYSANRHHSPTSQIAHPAGRGVWAFLLGRNPRRPLPPDVAARRLHGAQFGTGMAI